LWDFSQSRYGFPGEFGLSSPKTLRLVFLICIFSSAIFAEERATPKNGLSILAERLLCKNAGDRFFYDPTKTGPYPSDEDGFKFEDVAFASADCAWPERQSGADWTGRDLI